MQFIMNSPQKVYRLVFSEETKSDNFFILQFNPLFLVKLRHMKTGGVG